ncbi:MAG: endonuclease/exonuclease/phosphatase family protein [Candidatus Marinimicrobia bacterium]|nr:endonuclease/exonuclease/phosphatase family protein [Candidatus Neomarinimicrobiota bacterium]
MKNITLQVLTDTTLSITWQGDFGPDDTVRIDRKVGEASWQSGFKTIRALDYSGTDTLSSVHTDTVYAYRLKLFEDNDISSHSQSVALLSAQCVPAYLTVRQIDQTTIRIAWRDQSVGEAGFRIDRQIGGGVWQIAYAISDSNTCEFFDTRATSSAEIRYRIAAYSGASLSAFSQTVGVTLAPLTLDNLYFGTETTFEVMTWNLLSFPRMDSITIGAVSQAIKALDIDVIGLQEIRSAAGFQQLLDSLGTWNGYRANSAAYDIDLAFVYNPANITLLQIYEIEAFRRNNAFPRTPLVIELVWQDIPLVVINNHYKAYDEEDDRSRRLNASTLLENYISDSLNDANVIVIGDLNDELTDAQPANVFWPFLSRSAEYKFTDYDIAIGSHTYWSYPTWPSHIDHILITNELFSAFANSASEVKIIMVDNYMSGGWNEYAVKISDHRPVALKLAF